MATSFASGALLAERYEILREIGADRSGRLYQAVDRQLGLQAVALWLLEPDVFSSPEVYAGFQRQFSRAREQPHPHIVRPLALSKTGDLKFLALEWVDGLSLGELMKLRGGAGLDEEEIYWLLEQIVPAVEFCLQKDIVGLQLTLRKVLLHFGDGLTPERTEELRAGRRLPECGDVVVRLNALRLPESAGRSTAQRAAAASGVITSTSGTPLDTLALRRHAVGQHRPEVMAHVHALRDLVRRAQGSSDAGADTSVLKQFLSERSRLLSRLLQAAPEGDGDPPPVMSPRFPQVTPRFPQVTPFFGVAVSAPLTPAPLVVPATLREAGHPATLLRLMPEEDGPGEPKEDSGEEDSRPPALLSLVARPVFLLGRSRRQANYVAQFWPQTEANNRRTMKISRRQTSLSLEMRQIHVRDLGSSNGTYVEGRRLEAGKSFRVMAPSCRLSLGEIYQMELRLSDSGAPRGPAIVNLEEWHPVAAVAVDPLAPERPPGCAFLRAVTPETLAARVVWLFTDCTFGDSSFNPVALPDLGLAAVQGRLHWFQGVFWLEALADNSALAVDGHVLRPGEVAPLSAGARLRVGELSCTVTLEA